MDNKVFISHFFFQRKDFFMNPKAKVAACSLLSKTSKNSSNGPKLAKWFPKTGGGRLIIGHSLVSTY